MPHTMPVSRRTSPPRPNRRERRSVEIREKLFRAALRLFAERGYMETTVEDITDAADVGKGTFFNYFPTKEHVLATYGEERLRVIEHALETARSGAVPVLTVLRALATELAGQSAESPALLRSIFAAHASSAPIRAELQQRLHRARKLMARIFAVGQERGEIRKDLSSVELGRATQVVLQGVCMAWSINPDSTSQNLAESVWNLFHIGLLAGEKQESLARRSRKR